MAFLGQEEQIREFQDRFKYLYAVVFVGLGFLMSRLVFLQVLEGEKMRQYSEENRIKRVKITAPRGMIFDRNRKLLIDNRPAFDLEIVPQYLRESKQTTQVIALLSRLIKMPESEIEDILEKNSSLSSFMPVKIKIDLTRNEVAAIESWKIGMPGVDVKEEIKRTNIFGDIASHLLGYIGEVNTTELPLVNKEMQRYKLGDSIGKFGLEQRMESVLRGADGEEIKEVDALGRAKLDRGKERVITVAAGKEPIPGKNLILTIDQDLQVAGTKAFGDKIGSMVAIDPRSGQILAMFSRPSFDPTEFSRGIPPALWSKLLTNDNHPLMDKTIQDHYSPGSTFKLVTAIAGLEEGVIDVNTTFHCTGSLRVGNHVYRCWNKHGHGDVNVVRALTESCDVFFYRVALKLKSVDDIAKWAFKLGLGKKTGINLSREIPGLIPTEEWKEKRFNQQWNAGETVSVAIGQSFVLTTSLQLANLYAAVGNGGTLYRPYIVKEIESYEGQVLKEFQPEAIEHFQLHPKTLELVKSGIWGVMNTLHGTGYASRLPGMDFAGKTGSAQVVRQAADARTKCENAPFRDRDNALFVGLAPLQNPVIAVAVVAEHACHGASAAAPIAKAVIKAYLQKFNPALYGEKEIAERLKKEGQSLASAPKGHPTPADEEDTANTNDDNDLIKQTNTVAPPPIPPPMPGNTNDVKQEVQGELTGDSDE